jgi:hypothetical protein
MIAILGFMINSSFVEPSLTAEQSFRFRYEQQYLDDCDVRMSTDHNPDPLAFHIRRCDFHISNESSASEMFDHSTARVPVRANLFDYRSSIDHVALRLQLEDSFLHTRLQ